jgi:hypothetical protein
MRNAASVAMPINTAASASAFAGKRLRPGKAAALDPESNGTPNRRAIDSRRSTCARQS